LAVKPHERRPNDGDPPEKNLTRLAFQGHSRSLEQTRIDRLPMTSC